MKMSNRRTLFALTLLLIGSLSCSLFFPATPAPEITTTPSITDTPTPPPTATFTPVPVSRLVEMTSIHFEESGQSPNYTITSETPSLAGLDDPRIHAFNSRASDIVNGDIDEFKASLKYMPETPLTSGSFIDVGYEVLSPPGDPLSLKFNVIGYGDGAAHPYHYSQTLTFDLEQGKEIKLEQLFLPGSKYLEALADYCKVELTKRDIDFGSFSSGADPTSENYRNWNITPAGLLITFDEYQVAAYAAGPQTVLIPYADLKTILDPSGLLARFIP